MNLKKGSKLYVRVDKAAKKKITGEDINDHMEYVEGIASERFFIGGGFANINGGMILMEAKNIAEARKIFQDDPLIAKGFYNCEVYAWKLVVLSEQ